MNMEGQRHLFEEDLDLFDSSTKPADVWDEDSAKRALDELFSLTMEYRSSEKFQELLQFIARFPCYSPFNAMLMHVQMPGARYVAPPHRWWRDYKRTVKPGERPLVILQPMGPVMFVFDVSQTEGKELPPEVTSPFEPSGVTVGNVLEKTIENSKRDGIAVHTGLLGSQRGGSILALRKPCKTQEFCDVQVLIRFELELDENASRESRYASLVHELAHLYCGHLGTPDQRWWPDRRGLSHSAVEFEAESVAYMVCARFGVKNPSETYLSGYVGREEKTPSISLDCVMKAAGLIESMGKGKLQPRKDGK